MQLTAQQLCLILSHLARHMLHKQRACLSALRNQNIYPMEITVSQFRTWMSWAIPAHIRMRCIAPLRPVIDANLDALESTNG